MKTFIIRSQVSKVAIDDFLSSLILPSNLYAMWKMRNEVRFGSKIDVAVTVKILEEWKK